MATNSSNTNSTNQNQNSNPDVSQTPPGGSPPGQVPVPFPNIGKLASGKKHIPAVKPKVFELVKLTKKSPMPVHFKPDEPKEDTKGSGDNSNGKTFRSQKFLLHTDFLNTTKTKMIDVWNWFNMNFDLSKNVCEKHKLGLAMSQQETGGKGLSQRRALVCKNWIKCHLKGAVDITDTKPLADSDKNKHVVNLEIEDYPLVLSCAIKQSTPDAPATIEIGLNTKAILLVATNSEKKEIEVKGQLPNKERFHLLPAIIFESIIKFVKKYEVKAKEYAAKELQKLLTFATEMKKKRLDMRLQMQKLDDSDDIKLKWEKDGNEIKEAMIGDKVKLIGDFDDVDNGQAVTIKLYEHDADKKHDHIKDFQTMVSDKKVEIEWDVEYHEDKDDTDSQKEQNEKGYTLPEYMFTVDGFSVESGVLDVKSTKEITVTNEETGEPVKSAEFTIIFPDGTEQSGTTSDKGIIKVEKCNFKHYDLIIQN